MRSQGPEASIMTGCILLTKARQGADSINTANICVVSRGKEMSLVRRKSIKHDGQEISQGLTNRRMHGEKGREEDLSSNLILDFL